MNATKLAVAGFFAMSLMFAANTQTASAGPYHGRFGHYAYWGHRPVYSVAPVTTCVADAAVVPVVPPVVTAPVVTAPVVTAPVVTAPVVTATVPVCAPRVYFRGYRYGFRHWRR
jgi:hypothetical protein